MIEQWRRSWTLPLLVLLGVALGSANVAVNHGYGPASEHLSKALGNDWAWLVAGFCACWTGRTWRSSIGHGMALLLPAVMTYEVLDFVVRRQEGIQAIGSPVPFTVFWSISAVVASVALTGLIVLIRRGGTVGVLAAAALPAFIANSAHDNHTQAGDDPAMLEVTGILWPAAASLTVVILALGIARVLIPRR